MAISPLSLLLHRFALHRHSGRSSYHIWVIVWEGKGGRLVCVFWSPSLTTVNVQWYHTTIRVNINSGPGIIAWCASGV